MDAQHPSEHPFEPERYERYAEPVYRFNVNRRQFFKLFGGGLAVVCVGTGALALQPSDGANDPAPTALPDDIGSWLHIGEDGTVTVYTGKVEVGQNIRTSLTQAVAEELRVPVEAVQLVMGDTDLTPYDRGTFGSRTTPTMAPRLRSAAAAAREVLIDLAAETWQADRGALVVAAGKVTHPATGRSVAFGALTQGQKLVQTIAADAPVTPATQWKVAGTSVPKVGGRAFVTGEHRYVSDMKLPDMRYGKILRPPAFGATLRSLDAGRAGAMDGVTVVHDGSFVGVAAPDPQTAARAVAAMRAEWDVPPQPSRAELFDYLKEHAAAGRGGRDRHVTGDVEQGLAAADETLAHTYTIDFIAHAPLEPRAALAQWAGDKLTVWTGTQRPFGVRSELAEAFRIPEERVRVIMPDTGSGYGGKHTGEAAVEAARLARAAGKPVKLVWTREEEFTWAYFRPAGVIEVRSGVRRDGTVTAWAFHNYNSGGAAIETPYVVPNQHIAFHAVQSPLRQGSYRGLAAPANVFARESQMDAMARLVSMDPLAFRLKNLRDARLQAVFEAAAEAFGWRRAKPAPGHGFGIAGGVDKGGYVATCAEVAVDRASGHVQVVRVVAAFECGAVVNPDHLKNQVEGSIIQGLGGALFESIDFADGRVLNPRFSRYRVPRFSDTPLLDVILLDRKDLPSAGAGEAPIIGIAPAVGNAIFDATGIRLHTLPMAPHGLET